MRAKILDVTVENVVKGKSRYSKATVAYSYNGEAKTRNIMGFANPDVFKKVQEFIGQEVEITLGKNEAGYDEWTAIGAAGGDGVNANPSGTPVATGGAVRVTGSNYETPAERAQKQVYIVKQSSITAALTYFGSTGEAPASVQQVIDTAQLFVDYVFDNKPVDAA